MEPIDKGVIHKEIDLIIDVIKRMANNSFLAKGWLITLLGVIIALSKDNISTLNDSSKYLFLMLCMPILMFWYIDAYFLWQERFYRHLYNWVIVERPLGNTEHLYSLTPHVRFKDKANVRSIWGVIVSETLIIFYSLPLTLCVAVSSYLHFTTSWIFVVAAIGYIGLVLFHVLKGR